MPLEVSQHSNEGTVVAASLYCCSALQADCRALHMQHSSPTTDLVLLSGTLLHLDLCISVLRCLRPVSFSLLFPSPSLLVVVDTEC